MNTEDKQFTYADGVTLKEYLEVKLCALEKATTMAANAMDRRLESMNEFRIQLKDQANSFMTREAYEAKHELLQKQVDDLRLSRAELSGRASQGSVYIAYLFSIIGVVLGVISIFH